MTLRECYSMLAASRSVTQCGATTKFEQNVPKRCHLQRKAVTSWLPQSLTGIV
jgi:hypothetical protein